MTESREKNLRRPQQRRSHETQNRLLQAARDLLEERVFEELSVQEIASRAGCSVGAFYGRFENKDALLPHLLDLHYREMESEIIEAFPLRGRSGPGLEEKVGNVVDYLIRLARSQRGLVRTLVLRNLLRPKSIPPEIRQSASRILSRIYDSLLECRHEMLHPDAETAVEVGILMVVSAARERFVMVESTHSSTLAVDEEVLVTELKRALLAYLTGSGSSEKNHRRRSPESEASGSGAATSAERRSR